MIDFYLKFASEEEANAVLYTVIPEVLKEEGEVVSEEQIKPNFANIDVLGTIYEPTTEVDSDGYLVMVAMEGWHVNVRVIDEDYSALGPYKVSPTQPIRVWG